MELRVYVEKRRSTGHCPAGRDGQRYSGRHALSVADRLRPPRTFHTYTYYYYQWLYYSARGGGSLQEGSKLEPEGPRAEVGFPAADHGFSSIQGTLLGFCGI